MKIHCRTNLDLHHAEKWPTDLPEVPRVGDHIESGMFWRQGRNPLRLKVVAVTWQSHQNNYGEEVSWEPEIELHLPRNFENISQFEEWYYKLTGRHA